MLIFDKLIKYHLMLFKDTFKVPFKHKQTKILSVSIAHSNTFLLLKVDRPGQQQTLVHLDEQGKVLWQKSYKHALNSFAMMVDHEAIVLNVPEHSIDIIDLRTYDIIQVKHHYLHQNTASLSIETFCHSNLLCIVEKGDYKEQQLRLTYYNYYCICEKTEPQIQWYAVEDEWSYDHVTKKLDNYSKIGWWMPFQNAVLSFCYFDLKQSKQGQLSFINIDTTSINYQIQKFELQIFNLWQSSPNKYTLVGQSTKICHPDICKNAQGVVNDNYIIDLSEGPDKATIQETSFVFKDKSEECWHDALVDCFGLENFSVFHTVWKNGSGNTIKTPIFYVHNLTRTIIEEDTWKCSSFSSNFFFPGWSAGLLIRSQFGSSDCDQIVVTVNRLFQMKELILHMLLYLEDDFDDDLLYDVVCLCQQ